jgi:hypothetical protein
VEKTTKQGALCSALLIKYYDYIIKSRRRWVGHVARMRKRRCANKVLVGGLEGRRPLGRPRRKWGDNIKN